MPPYCSHCNSHPEDLHNRVCHDTEYGFPIEEDDLLFERLILEINQAGLSLITTLTKADNFKLAYSHFDIDAVAAQVEADRARLLSDAGIIRNRLKVNAANENARRIQSLRGEYRSFTGWLDHHYPLTLKNQVKLFKCTFVFAGGDIVNEFLMSTGYLPGAHTPDCPIYETVLAMQPAWIPKETQSWRINSVESIKPFSQLLRFLLKKTCVIRLLLLIRGA